MDELLADFLTETNENLAELDVALLTLERAPDDANTLSLIFRMVHTIKGTCGFLGLPRLERVAHAGENVLGRLRDGALVASPEIVTLILAALDRIKSILSDLGANGTEPAGDDTGLIASLNAMAQGQTPPPAAAPPPCRRPTGRTRPRRGPARPGRRRTRRARTRAAAGQGRGTTPAPPTRRARTHGGSRGRRPGRPRRCQCPGGRRAADDPRHRRCP